jgi:hypothetical protein
MSSDNGVSKYRHVVHEVVAKCARPDLDNDEKMKLFDKLCTIKRSDNKLFHELITIIENVIGDLVKMVSHARKNWHTLFELLQSDGDPKEIQYFRDPFSLLQ